MRGILSQSCGVVKDDPPGPLFFGKRVSSPIT